MYIYHDNSFGELLDYEYQPNDIVRVMVKRRELPQPKSKNQIKKEFCNRYKVVFGTDKKGKDTTVLINKDTNEKTIVKRHDLEERDYDKAIMYALLKEQGITCDVIDELIKKGKDDFKERKNIKKKKQEQKCKKTFESILNEAKGE